MRDEAEIIREVCEGNAEAFAELVRAHQARVRLACLVWLGRREDADDAAQDVFVKAFKALDTFKGTSSFRTWLLRIAENHSKDLLRSRKVRPTESLDTLLAEKGDAIESLLIRHEQREEIPYSQKDLELLGRLFSALPTDDREILALREVEMLSYEEIASKLACSVDAVKGRLKRARQTLMEKCRHFVDTSETRQRL